MTGDQLVTSNKDAPNGAPLSDQLGEELTRQEAEAILQQLARVSGPLPSLLGRAGTCEGTPSEEFPAAESFRTLREQHRTEAKLRLAEARYHTLVEQIPAVTFLAALDEGINELYVSPQIETLLGFTQKEWLEDPVLWYRQLHPDDRQGWQEDFARTCAAGEHFRSQYRFRARDGRVVWVHGECQVVRDDTGRPLFLQGIAYDITENKRAEEALRQMHADLAVLVQERTAELAQANQTLQAEILERRRLEEVLRQRAEQLVEEGRRKDHFLAILAHELRNPLAPIRNALAILRQPEARGSASDWAKAVMERQVRHMTRLIDDLLDVSRINQGKIDLRLEVVDLATIIPRAVEATRPLLSERRHQLTLSLAAEPLHLDGDPVRLEQVLVNLLNNAAKYTEPGGHVRLGVGREGGEAVLRVQDNGAGIPPEMLERIFDLFTQVERSLASTSQWGLGIGLTLVRNLVELHGGSVRAFSAGPGHGSEFIVRLPLLREAPGRGKVEPASPGRPAAPALARSRRVLVVDDNADLAESLALLFRHWGHEVSVAADGPAALAVARVHPPEVILLDIGLPGMTGYEVARQLRKQVGVKQAFLVALSGYGREEDRLLAREAGFDHHLTKPVDPESLKELLMNSRTLSAPTGDG